MPIPILAGVAAVGALANIGASIYATRARVGEGQRNRALFRPYTEAGERGLDRYEDLLRNPSSVRQTPGYDFRLQEGQKALERSAAARGASQSGAHAKALLRYGQGFAAQEYDRALSRTQGLAQVGAQGLGGYAAANQQLGDARASGYVTAANSLRGGLQDYLYGQRLGQLGQSGYGAPASFNPSSVQASVNPYGLNPYR